MSQILFRFAVWMCAAVFLPLDPAAADTRPVSGPEELQAALAAEGTTVIELEGGRYGRIHIERLAASASNPLVIRSIDPANPAILAELRVVSSANITFQDIRFDYSHSAADLDWHWPFSVILSDGIVVHNSIFDGDVATGRGPDADGLGFATGLYVQDSTQITIADNEISGFRYGLKLVRTRDVTVRGNDIHSLRQDGMQLVEVDGVLVEGNFIHDFLGKPNWDDHRDMIQLWTAGTTMASRRVTIRGNVLNSGLGSYTQTIFMGNEQVWQNGAGPEMYYRDLLIEENVIINAHLHGVTIGEADGVTVRNNTLIRNPLSDGTGELSIPRINISPAARNVRIERNVVADIRGYEEQTDWHVADNFLIQDRGRMEPGFYGAVFADHMTGPMDLEAYSYRPGGPLAGTNLGAGMLDTIRSR